jgi:hypothetical protein
MFGEQKNSLPIQTIGPQPLGCPGHSLVTVMNEIPGSTMILIIIIINII